MSSTVQDKLIDALTPMLERLGYELVYLEIVPHRQKVLRIFIDRINAQDGGAIGIEDCAVVSRALDEPLEQMPEIEAAFHGSAYELEVSSPGVDRPLRQNKDYERFSGSDVRIHVFRPLTAEELQNKAYQEKNPKQKNFLGTLRGLTQDKVRLQTPTKEGEVLIPLTLISKANIEPKFDDLEQNSKRSKSK